MLTKQEIAAFDIDPVIRFCYDYILPISEDRVLATHGGQISLITKDGEMLCTYDSIEVPTYHSDKLRVDTNGDYVAEDVFVDDYLLIRENGLWGIIDYDGDIILSPVHNKLGFTGPDSIEYL